MVATGSHGFSVKNLLIPSNRAFIINRRFAHLPQPIYQYPFFALAQITLAVNSSGMAMRFLDICTSNVGIDKYLPIQKKLPNAYAKLEKQRQTFYKEVALSWAQCKAQKLSSKTFKKVGKLSKELAHQSLRIVDSLFPLCGMEAANPATEINRVWRNMHTASQHSIFNK